MKLRAPRPEHKALRDELIAVIRRHGKDLPSEEILAVTAYLVGQVIALQDQRKMSRDMAMELVGRNIEAGNSQAISDLLTAEGGRA